MTADDIFESLRMQRVKVLRIAVGCWLFECSYCKRPARGHDHAMLGFTQLRRGAGGLAVEM